MPVKVFVTGLALLMVGCSSLPESVKKDCPNGYSWSSEYGLSWCIAGEEKKKANRPDCFRELRLAEFYEQTYGEKKELPEECQVENPYAVKKHVEGNGEVWEVCPMSWKKPEGSPEGVAVLFRDFIKAADCDLPKKLCKSLPCP